MNYRRILLKLSGESLAQKGSSGIATDCLHHYADEVISIASKGVQVAIVLGGGNIYRGLQGEGEGMDRAQGDYMGMLATIINSMALQAELEKRGYKSRILSGIAIDPLCERMSRRRAKEYLEAGTIVFMAGGTGNPFFTTDSAAALRAIEIEADLLIKGTRVNGIYTADPEKDPTATKYDTLSFEEAYQKKLNIMDMTAFTLCQENNMPILVIDINEKGGLARAIAGEATGTLVSQ
ncbi:MAG: UMP kinase [Bacteroidota bacterium]